MTEPKVEYSDFEGLSESSSFIESLAKYYSDFLATDFKKGRLPKRRFQTRDTKGRRAGITLEKFPTFLPLINKLFKKEFGTNCAIKIKPKSHQVQLSAVVLAAVDAEIKNIDFDELNYKNDQSGNNYQIAIGNKEADLESENEKFITDLQRNVGAVIGAVLLNKLEPIFRKSASNLVDALISVDEDLAHLIVSPIEATLPSVLYKLISDQDDGPLKEVLDEIFNKNRITELLKEYFSTFSAGDLATEIRELHTVEQLDDNLEFYLYFGNARYKNNSFPLFYMPFKIEYETSEATLNFEPRILVNKKAIDYLAHIIQDATNTRRASPIKDRIIYLEPAQTVFEQINDILEPILRSFQFEGDLSFSGKREKLTNSEVTIVNSLNFALFDKSDESMLTDYEELLQKIEEKSGDLLGFIDELVDSFLTENPTTITNQIHNEWEEAPVERRLVFDSPIPLAEEQRKILAALNNPTGRFVTVEGPPGTGKSHTISAIAFEAILKGQSILVLSDKKEALDVVENKLNDTLSKVRPSDDFVNPILRLGRVGTNFKKILSKQSIEKLRVQHQESKKGHSKRKELYAASKTRLMNSIEEKSHRVEEIDISSVIVHEQKANAFIAKWERKFPKFKEIFDAVGDQYANEISSIEILLTLRDSCIKIDPQIIEFSNEFGGDVSGLKMALKFVYPVRILADETRIFKIAPDIDYSKLSVLRSKINEIRSSKGFFGYAFAKKQINVIRNSIHQLVGYNPRESEGDRIIAEIQGLLDLANKFYSTFFIEYESLIFKALDLKLSHPKVQHDVEYLQKDLAILQAAIDNKDLPFLGKDESILEMLTDVNNESVDFYDDFVGLRNKKKEIEQQFLMPSYNYAGRKREIESYNALKLATEIDSRVIDFAHNRKNDAKAISEIISQKKRFPKKLFGTLLEGFPCMICSLRDYAEYIPLERELFDIIIIDEASQVSIAQAFPAIIRAKKMIILGDRKQFGNVKTSNASKELNTSYFTKVKAALKSERMEFESDLEIRVEKLNIGNSILDFMENLSNFDIMLKKHFRGYPEMISFSSKYFYNNSLQAMKVRGKPVDQILKFVELEHDGKTDIYKNTNEQEALHILDMILHQLESQDLRSVAVITPFTEQQTLISKLFSNHAKYEEFSKLLKFRSFTFDSCQGEERDLIYYSFVATPDKDKLWAVLPKKMDAQDEEELDRNKKLQRMNVAFSRGKEKLIFVHSKPISEFSAGKEALNHYKDQLERAKHQPTSADVDPLSEAEKYVLEWIKQSKVVLQHNPEIQPQFEIGKYLKMLDGKYQHPKYRVDFLLRFWIKGTQRDIIIEYDGFQFHFDNQSEVDAGNWRQYMRAEDVERDHILESYGYPTIRLNKFNTGENPIETINDLIEEVLKNFEDPGDAFTKEVITGTALAHEGLQNKTFKHCKKCEQNKPISKFENPNRVTGYNLYCNVCKPVALPKKKKKPTVPDGKKKCPRCKDNFPLTEFVDKSNPSGKRSYCGKCKKISNRNQAERARAWHNR